MSGSLAVPLRWRQSFLELVFAVYLFWFAEWLFQVTKPSFMSALSFPESLRILVVSPLYLLILLLPLQAALEMFHALGRRALGDRCPSLAMLVPAVVHCATALLLIDNFTYTLFGVGVFSLRGGVRYVFTGVWFGLFAFILTMRGRRFRRALLSPRGVDRRFRFALVLVAVGLFLGGLQVTAAVRPGVLPAVIARPQQELPDVLFLSMDAVEAEHSSSYGYERVTTPFLDELAPTALVFENAFTNSCCTAGAMLGLLSGQRPTDFRVFIPPMTLQGAHAYQHLPGILRTLGYRSAQIALPYWASAQVQGMRNAFDYVNGLYVPSQSLAFLPAYVADRLPSEQYFLVQTRRRVRERSRHMLGLEDMLNYMNVVKNLPQRADVSDAQRATIAIRFLEENQGHPVFLQVHLLTGHCCRYHVPAEHRRFSSGSSDPTGIDFYDDAIRTMDAYLGMIITWLEQKGRLDDTLIVITADHTRFGGTLGRIPLLIRFPGAQPHGRVSANTQLADVAPTVLDYLDVPKPAWMTGESLLHSEGLDRLRPIFGASDVERTKGRKPTPPLHGLASASAVICDRWYEWILKGGELTSGPVEGHTAPCGVGEHIPDLEVKALLNGHLMERGFVLPGE